MPSYRRTAVCVAALFVATPVLAQEAAPPVPAAIAVADADRMPEPPAGIAATFVTPARDSQGAYRTPNRDLSPSEATWHLRAALNVAALGCRGEGAAETTAAYNAMLETHRIPLATAMRATEARMRAEFGADWQAENDTAMTRLYNFFAAPPAQTAFCAAARDVLRETATLEPDAFPVFAAAALPRLEAPFLAMFAACDEWRARVAAWRARRDPPAAPPEVLIASAATVSPAIPVALRSGPEGP